MSKLGLFVCLDQNMVHLGTRLVLSPIICVSGRPGIHVSRLGCDIRLPSLKNFGVCDRTHFS